MTASPQLTARHYEPADFPTINSWYIDHRGHDMSEAYLPPLGVMVEDERGPLCVLFAHLSTNIGIAFLEDPVARPYLSAREARRGFAYVIDAMREALRSIPDEHGEQAYTLMICHTIPGIARELRRNHGFIQHGDRIRMEARI